MTECINPEASGIEVTQSEIDAVADDLDVSIESDLINATKLIAQESSSFDDFRNRVNDAFTVENIGTETTYNHSAVMWEAGRREVESAAEEGRLIYENVVSPGDCKIAPLASLATAQHYFRGQETN